jgi:hypothetical protein
MELPLYGGHGTSTGFSTAKARDMPMNNYLIYKDIIFIKL